MLIATFGPSSSCAGRTITFEDGQFVHEVLGPTSAAQVVDYDRHGHLTWPYGGMRAWLHVRAGGQEPTILTEKVEPPAPTRPRATAEEVKATAPTSNRKARPEAQVPWRRPEARYAKRNPSARAVWHIIERDRYIHERGGEWEGQFRVTFCGQTVHPDAEIADVLPGRATVCKRCMREAGS